MSSHNMPIFRIEIERMKFSLLAALSEYAVQLDGQLKESIEKFCTPENVASILDAVVGRELKTAIEAEVQAFFAYGKGRQVIKDAVNKKLEREYL